MTTMKLPTILAGLFLAQVVFFFAITSFLRDVYELKLASSLGNQRLAGLVSGEVVCTTVAKK